MPELPEVETIKRDLEKLILGKKPPQKPGRSKKRKPDPILLLLWWMRKKVAALSGGQTRWSVASRKKSYRKIFSYPLVQRE